jgi:hypothetical protein
MKEEGRSESRSFVVHRGMLGKRIVLEKGMLLKPDRQIAMTEAPCTRPTPRTSPSPSSTSDPTQPNRGIQKNEQESRSVQNQYCDLRKNDCFLITA